MQVLRSTQLSLTPDPGVVELDAQHWTVRRDHLQRGGRDAILAMRPGEGGEGGEQA